MFHVERFQFFCPDCHTKGIISDVLLNASVLLLRGLCPECGARSQYKAANLETLFAQQRQDDALRNLPVLSKAC